MPPSASTPQLHRLRARKPEVKAAPPSDTLVEDIAAATAAAEVDDTLHRLRARKPEVKAPPPPDAPIWAEGLLDGSSAEGGSASRSQQESDAANAAAVGATITAWKAKLGGGEMKSVAAVTLPEGESPAVTV